MAKSARRRVKIFIAVFVSAFIICGVFGIEAWPLTGWRLFADTRERHIISWQATTIDANGNESPLSFSSHGPAFGGGQLIVDHFSDTTDKERSSVCSSWLSTTRARAIRIYRLDRDLAVRHGHRGGEAKRIARFECHPEGVEGIG